MGTYAYSGNQNKQRDNHADEYLPDLLNDIQDEIEIVEQVLSGGEEGQVLTADSTGKAQWGEGGSDVQGVDVKSTAPEKMIIVSGAGSSEVNGNYKCNGEENG